MKPFPSFFSCLLPMGLLLVSGPVSAFAQTYTQPPIIQWGRTPKAAPIPAPAEAPTSSPAPAALPDTETTERAQTPAPVEKTTATTSSTAASKPSVVKPVSSEPKASKSRSNQPITEPTPPPGGAAAILAFQANNEAPGQFQPILGAEATRSYKRYLQSFTHPIPESFASTGAGQAVAGSGTVASGMGGGYGIAQ